MSPVPSPEILLLPTSVPVPMPVAAMVAMLLSTFVVAVPAYFAVKGTFLEVPATALPATSASAMITAAGAAIVIRNVFTVAPFGLCDASCAAAPAPESGISHTRATENCASSPAQSVVPLRRSRQCRLTRATNVWGAR